MVIALVVMIGGLIFPALSSRVAAERTSSVSREIAALGLIARGEAARSEAGVSLYILTGVDGLLHAGIARGADFETASRERVYSFPAGWSVSIEDDADGAANFEPADEPIMLALYLPDGTVAAANAGVLVARDEVRLRISASSVTGEITVERAPEAGAEDEDGSDDDAGADDERDEYDEAGEDPEPFDVNDNVAGGRE